VDSTVRAVLSAVERGGDNAVARYAKKFDRVSLKPAQFRITPDRVKDAYYHIRKEEGDALRYAAQRITAFHERQRTRTWMYQDDGATLGQMIVPLDDVGVYVPGGKAVYPSTILMTVIPAKVAGVRRVAMCTPPSKDGISPYLLVAADIAGVGEIYQIGGVQAIAAMAYESPRGQDRGAGECLRGGGQTDDLRAGGHRHDRRPERAPRSGGRRGESRACGGGSLVRSRA
jgi:histidinol dehydrogenase